MGMFDYVDLGWGGIYCPYCNRLHKKWQTKDSPEQGMVTYRIRPDGIVTVCQENDEDDEDDEEEEAIAADYCGVWNLVADENCGHWLEAQIVIIDGKLYRERRTVARESKTSQPTKGDLP